MEKIWNETLKDYDGLYLKCEILLLADVFKKLRNNSLKNYRLCPSLFLSTSGLSWDAVLKMTTTKLELIPDPDMYVFFEKSIRSEISYICNGFSEPINKYLKTCDPKHESKHIILLEANNWCGYVMSKFRLPSRFKWIDSKEFDWNKYIRNI